MPQILPTRGPFARGVSQLMYVGSADEALQTGMSTRTMVGLAAAAYALLGNGLVSRAVAAGVAGWVYATRKAST